MKTALLIHMAPQCSRRSAPALIFTLATLGLTASVQADLPVAGVYNGTYQVGGQTGNLAMFVDGTGWAGLLRLNRTWSGGGYQEGIRVGTNGWFRGFTTSGSLLTGTIVGTNLNGEYGGGISSGTVTATVRPNTGPQAAAAGYYAGTILANYNNNGTIRAILAADGMFYGWMDYSYGGNAFTGAFNAQNQFAATNLDGTTITGALNTATLVISGNWSSWWDYGSFTLAPTHSVAGAVCQFSLSVNSTNAGSANTTAGFKVSTAANCSWTAVAETAWLHTTSTGSGSGDVLYTADANPNNAFRIGTIKAGGETFTVTQAPARFEWHPVFGWLYDAGGGWRYHNGFGWLWFDDGGVWIWSSHLRGWLAVTEPAGRTLWSQQFGWLTPSASDLYQANTSTLDIIYLGEYGGAALPEGWVKSDRFGHIWANGDARWFYSTTYGWLDVSPQGTIWCVSQGRILY